MVKKLLDENKKFIKYTTKKILLDSQCLFEYNLPHGEIKWQRRNTT